MNLKRGARPKKRGVYEKVASSDVWWITYADADGRRRRERAGTWATACKLYTLRRAAALEQRKMPETIRRKPVMFCELAERAMKYSLAHKRSHDVDAQRMPLLVDWFGPRPAASITPGEIEQRLTAAKAERQWSPATVNRYRSLLSLAFALAIKDGKVQANPVRGVKQLQENNVKERFLSAAEEERLKAAICGRHPEYWRPSPWRCTPACGARSSSACGGKISTGSGACSPSRAASTARPATCP